MELKYCEQCGQVVALDDPTREIEPGGNFVCFDCRTGGGSRKAKSKSGSKKGEPLDLFSSSTVAIKRKQMKAAGAKTQQGKVPAAHGPARSKANDPAAARLQFRCPDCQSTLRVPRVKKPSRIVCPKCRLNLFISPAGVISKNPPKGVAKKAVPVRRATGVKGEPSTSERPGETQRKSSLSGVGLRKTAKRERGDGFPEGVMEDTTQLDLESLPKAAEAAPPSPPPEPDPAPLPAAPAAEEAAPKPPAAGSPAATFLLRASKRSAIPASKAPPAVPGEQEAVPGMPVPPPKKSKGGSSKRSLVPVAVYLPLDLIEKAQETGKPVNKLIRDTLKDKLEGK